MFPSFKHGTDALRTSLAGFLALVIAMGIGRFAFTPMLPLMLGGGWIDITQGTWLATANYIGYLVGAMTVSRMALDGRTLIRASVPAIALLTAAMGWTGHMGLWLALRFGAGVLSAWVLVGTSAWCLAELARAGRASLGGVVYAGVGAGIALAGLYCLVGAGMGLAATALWRHLGGVAALLGVLVIALVPRNALPAPAASDAALPKESTGQTGLVVCYGCFGFGYILPATFLPAMGRAVLDDPAFFSWAWPVFGLAAAMSTLLAGSLLAKASRINLWAGSQVLMAVGTLLPALWPSPISVLVSATLVGGTFMVATMAGMQEARARAGANATRLLGRMTAAFATGQIAGPVSSTVLAHYFPGDLDGVRVALIMAAAVLLVSAAWLLRPSARPAPQFQGVSR